jgi:hypothetical protein
MKFVQKSIDNINSIYGSKSKDEMYMIKIVCLAFLLLMECLFGLYYIILGSYIGITYFTILTVLQLLTIIITCKKQLNLKIISENIEDYTFYRGYFLFNIVLDLIYYPLAIYLMLI